eukprot:TRINITY_DN6202_c0_g1_i1.p1 TRINITY_DN6202_c0_g1~~TRINITY_DN6202_c0_g1_i1.p1  ORF type:complete len:375 (-),score=54.63 TRINITY_DN6202_c0_g1_i1:326-1450(-)
MSSSCTHGIRLLSRHTLCLDIIHDNFAFTWRESKMKRANRNKRNSEKGKEMKAPLLSRSKELLNSSTDSYDSGGGYDGGDDGDDVDGVTDSEILYEKMLSKKVKQDGFGFVYFCFFMAGIALNICWGSISFLIPYWQAVYGKTAWSEFLVCYNLPGFPILIFQLFCDNFFHRKVGFQKMYIGRVMATLTIIALLVGLLPFIHPPKHVILVYIIIIGICVGAAYGWIFSLASLYPHKAVSYVVAGGGMSTLILLVLSLSERIQPVPSFTQLLLYFGPVFVVCLICIGFVLYMLLNPVSSAIFKTADGMMRATGVSIANSEISNEPENDLKVIPFSDDYLHPSSSSIYAGHVLKYIWSPVLSIFLTVFSSQQEIRC